MELKKDKKNKIILFSLALVLFFSIGCLSVILSADIVNADDYGLDKTAEVGYGERNVAIEVANTPAVIIGKVVGAGLAFIGVIFLVLMIYGGFTWMMARGNEQDVAKAKELIYSAIIGLIIVLAAYAITAYVGSILGQ